MGHARRLRHGGGLAQSAAILLTASSHRADGFFCRIAADLGVEIERRLRVAVAIELL